jgi:hypothetical protein
MHPFFELLKNLIGAGKAIGNAAGKVADSLGQVPKRIMNNPPHASMPETLGSFSSNHDTGLCKWPNGPCQCPCESCKPARIDTIPEE